MSVNFSRTCSSLTPARLLFSRRQEKYRILEPIIPVPPQATASPYPVSTTKLLVSDSRVILITCLKSGYLRGWGGGVSLDGSLKVGQDIQYFGASLSRNMKLPAMPPKFATEVSIEAIIALRPAGALLLVPHVSSMGQAEKRPMMATHIITYAGATCEPWRSPLKDITTAKPRAMAKKLGTITTRSLSGGPVSSGGGKGQSSSQIGSDGHVTYRQLAPRNGRRGAESARSRWRLERRAAHSVIVPSYF